MNFNDLSQNPVSDAHLTVNELSLSYHPSSKTVLDQISFELPQGQIACLVGQSGCGKTSLLRCIAGFETPTAGSIQFGKRTLFDSRTHINIPAYQRQIGIVFQDYALFPHLTVADNIGFGLQHLSKTDRQGNIDALLTLIGLEHLACRYPHELSGGQQQRVALARAIAPNPQLILFDEPFSSLDADMREALAMSIQQLLKAKKISAIVVTHDQQEAFMIADKIGMLADGRLQQWDTPIQLYQAPSTPTVAKFVGKGSFLQAQQHGNELVTAIGTLPMSNYPYFADSHQVLIRPEWLSVVPQTNSAVNGLITAKQFKGSHVVYEVQLASQERVLVYSPTDVAILGESVGLLITHLPESRQ